MFDGFDEMMNSNLPPKKKGDLPGVSLGFVSPAQKKFLEQLGREHSHTIVFEFSGDSQIKASVFSKFPNKLAWVEWMFEQMKLTASRMNREFYAAPIPHPFDDLKQEQAIELPPAFGLNNFFWPKDSFDGK